ncbi:MAG: carboxypeptidase-like regulatory domain-containing protein [Prevotella sp.]|nr:carboxypeptidase-like regulatory domain-containing protein [Prevotella sp.]
MRRFTVFFLSLLLTTATALAQISGVVLDADDGEPVPYASVVYKGNDVGTKCDAEGRFTIGRHNGWRLTVSTVGYRSQVINVGPATPASITIRLKAEQQALQEVTVKSKRKTRYSRKNNPAVELMRKVIAAKKRNDLKKNDFYQYTNYQKIGLGLNDINPQMLDKGIFKKYPWLVSQVEVSQYNDKLVLPLTVDETVTRQMYRKEPQKERSIIMGQKSSGVNDLFQTGDILTTVMRDVFADVNLYDDYILLFRHKFSSPIGRDAILFYRYYITDTVYVGQDRCIHLDFTPNNPQDFGFRGQLYVLADSSYQVKRCELSLPQSNAVNWVEGFQCMQEFTRQADGQWLLTIDDMIVELMATDFLARAIITRTTRMSDFDFSPIPNSKMRGGTQEVEANSYRRSDEFWEQHRQVEFTKSERNMGTFLDHIEQLGGFKYVIFVLKAAFENYLETGSREHPSKFDYGPVNTTISQNFYDGWRLRVGGQTTANLNPHWFLKGYYARGMKSKEDYYRAELTYSLDRCNYLPQEFPIRRISFASQRDVALPSDKFIVTDKDNVFSSFKVHELDKMFLYNSQALNFDYETRQHVRFSVGLKTEHITPIGNIAFEPLSTKVSQPSTLNAQPSTEVSQPSTLNAIRYTESTFGIRIAPKEKFFNTKQRRRTLNKDAWYLSLQHTLGLNNVLGGEYSYNFSEMEFYKRTWLPMSWGTMDVTLKGGVQWNQVPYPLLIMPQANLSYIVDYNAYYMINNMEFLNDRYASLMLKWEPGGKILNRIPLFKKLKWREIGEFKVLWAGLSHKNNPYMAENAGSSILMQFPEGCYIMDGKRPYMEYAVGVGNILNFLQIEYVRRLNYLDLPTAQKHGIRFVLRPAF